MPKPKPTIPAFGLAEARRCGAKKSVLELFDDDELQGLQWFALVPVLFLSYPQDPQDFLFDQTNLLCGSFWSAYIRHPDEALQIVAKIRARALSEKQELALEQAMRKNPGASLKELVKEVIRLSGVKELDVDTLKKRRQRLLAAAKPRPRP